MKAHSMHLPSALIIAALLFVAKSIDAHDIHGPIEDAPYCGDMDSIAEPSPDCIMNDGDIPAMPDPAPTRVPCPSGHAAHVNCYEIGYWDEAPSGPELLALSRAENGSGEAVVIRVKTHWASGPHSPDLSPWWHHRGNHHRSDGDRASGNAGSADQGQPERDQEVVSRDEPRAEPQPAPAPPMNNGPMMGPGD